MFSFGPYTLRLVSRERGTPSYSFRPRIWGQHSAAAAAAGEVEKYSANAIGDGVIASLSWEWRKEGGKEGRLSREAREDERRL